MLEFKKEADAHEFEGERYVGIESVDVKPMSRFTFLKEVRCNEGVPFGEDMPGYCVLFEWGDYVWMPEDVFNAKYKKDDVAWAKGAPASFKDLYVINGLRERENKE